MPKRFAVALIDEARCIGCTRCIDACPVDAIAGAPGFMHTVIAAYCTGCKLCLPPCPVDCIDLVPAPAAWRSTDASAAKRRATFRKARMERDKPRSTATNRRAVIAGILKRRSKG